MDAERKASLLKRLKKCMALSASPEPHEAAAAMRHAQAIMRELGITEADLAGIELEERLVKTREGFGRCRVMMHLSNMLEDIFGVESVFERNPGSADRLNVRYIGAHERVLMAEYCHRVVWRAMCASWEKYLQENPFYKGNSGKRMSFHIGWLSQVRDKVEAIHIEDSEKKAIRTHMERKYGKSLSTIKSQNASLSGGAYYAGKEAADGFDIHRPIRQQNKNLEHK
jgi:hypothetical protein